MLNAIITAVIEGLFRLFAGRWFGARTTDEAYEAKAAEAKELAKPDSAWPDTVDRM